MKKCTKCGAFNNDSKLSCQYPTGINSCCGGELIVEKSTRELALEWWYNLTEIVKSKLYSMYYGANIDNGTWDDEIEEIWRKEIQEYDYTKLPMNDNSSIPNFITGKPNQKQFKEFNSELFKAYIDKFKHEDVRHAFTILERKLRKFGDKVTTVIK